MRLTATVLASPVLPQYQPPPPFTAETDGRYMGMVPNQCPPAQPPAQPQSPTYSLFADGHFLPPALQYRIEFLMARDSFVPPQGQDSRHFFQEMIQSIAEVVDVRMLQNSLFHQTILDAAYYCFCTQKAFVFDVFVRELLFRLPSDLIDEIDDGILEGLYRAS